VNSGDDKYFIAQDQSLASVPSPAPKVIERASPALAGNFSGKHLLFFKKTFAE